MKTTRTLPGIMLPVHRTGVSPAGAGIVCGPSETHARPAWEHMLPENLQFTRNTRNGPRTVRPARNRTR